MSIIVGGIAPRHDRNGAAATKWVAAQTYDVQRAAQDRTTSQAVLQDIAINGTARLASMVASNKSATDATLRVLLANYPNDEIRQRVAVHKNASDATLVLLFPEARRNGRLKEKVFRNPNLTASSRSRF